jgi:hypothetical protein
MKNVIRLGDPTSHGGRVLTAAFHYTAFGKPVARVGDTCVCPMPGHQVCIIVERMQNQLRRDLDFHVVAGRQRLRASFFIHKPLNL